jgi:hypothetical protein
METNFSVIFRWRENANKVLDRTVADDVSIKNSEIDRKLSIALD